MKILFDHSTESRIRECKIIADNGREEEHLMEARDKIIELLGSLAAVDVIKEGPDGREDQNDSEGTSGLFDTGGC